MFNILDSKQNTPLFYAAEGGYMQSVVMLLVRQLCLLVAQVLLEWKNVRNVDTKYTKYKCICYLCCSCWEKVPVKQIKIAKMGKLLCLCKKINCICWKWRVYCVVSAVFSNIVNYDYFQEKGADIKARNNVSKFVFFYYYFP